MKLFRIFLIIIFLIVCSLYPIPRPVFAASTPAFISENINSVQKYEKYEASFNITTSATNLQWPYDAVPPAGVAAGQGISVDAVLTSPSGKQFQQPMFYFQPFVTDAAQPFQVPKKDSKDWLYPSGNAVWMLRFAPNETGSWSYVVKAADGTVGQSTPRTFNVTDNTNNTSDTRHGFVRVSSKDPRYFEFDDGTYFPSMGYNMNYNHVNWNNPISDNLTDFQKMGQNGVQLVRIWLSEWPIFASNMNGEGWNPWHIIGSSSSGDSNPPLDTAQVYQDHDVSWRLSQSSTSSSNNPCASIGNAGWLFPQVSLLSNKNYRVRVLLKTVGITGPRTSGNYGFVVKISPNGTSWPDDCANAGSNTVVGPTYIQNTKNGSGVDDWKEVTLGTFSSGTLNYLTSVNLALENVNNGSYAYIDHIWIEEDLGNGKYGPNIMYKPGMNFHQYVDERSAYAFDKLLELAKANNVYIRPVLLDKQDYIFWRIDRNNGTILSSGNWDNFYGEYQTVTKSRWFQQAYWRYMQARYGYSTSIQSWELLNEGDPGSGRHATLTDEFAKYMHCRVFGITVSNTSGATCVEYNNTSTRQPDAHMASTSNWNSFPKSFWQTAVNADFADVHYYLRKTGTNADANYYDSAKATYDLSMQDGALRIGGVGRPVIRGETGFVASEDTNDKTRDFVDDPQGVWIHNLLWGGINSGGLIESYWYENYDYVGHIYCSGRIVAPTPSGSNCPANKNICYCLSDITFKYLLPFDYRVHYKYYYDFIKDIPLNKGNYVDAAATVSNTQIRVWGQKNTVNKQAHLWIANAAYTWNKLTPTAQTGTVKISGFTASASYPIIWWDTYAGAAKSGMPSTIIADSTGTITIDVSQYYPTGLVTDFAVKIGDYTAVPSPTPTVNPCSKVGDINCDQFVNATDLLLLLGNYGKSGLGDLNSDGKVNIIDAGIVIKNWGL